MSRDIAQWFKIFGPIPSIPEALLVFSEERALYTSPSEMVIVTIWLFTQGSKVLTSSDELVELVENTEWKMVALSLSLEALESLWRIVEGTE